MKHFFLHCLLFFFLLLPMDTATQEKNVEPFPATAREGQEDIARYVERFASQNALISLSSLDYIAYFEKDAIPYLLEGLHHENPQVRAFSAMALSRFPDKRAIAPLIGLLEDERSLNLQILSDDGRSFHGAYGKADQGSVQKNAWIALTKLTGLSLPMDAKLWLGWWQKEGETWEVPPSQELTNYLPDSVRYPIPSFARYLQGTTICLDPGHGGESHKVGFKRGPTGNEESESNLKVARFLRDFLQKCGARVLMTRDSDRFVSLEDRAQIANRHGAQVFISIHHNWSPRYTSQATTIWYHLAPDQNPASLDIGRYVFQEVTKVVPMRELDRAMGLKSDGMMYETGFGVLRALQEGLPGILCELAFFSNLQTELKMRDMDFLQQEAYGIFLGICRYFYAGIPSYKVLSPQAAVLSEKEPVFQIRVFDGLEDRKDWGAKEVRIIARHTVVELDGISLPYTYNRIEGTLRFQPRAPLSVGEHRLCIFLLNVNKNSNWPIVYSFVIQ